MARTNFTSKWASANFMAFKKLFQAGLPTTYASSQLKRDSIKLKLEFQKTKTHALTLCMLLAFSKNQQKFTKNGVGKDNLCRERREALILFLQHVFAFHRLKKIDYRSKLY